MFCYLREVELVYIGACDMAGELGSKFMLHRLVAPSPFFLWSLLTLLDALPMERCAVRALRPSER